MASELIFLALFILANCAAAGNEDDLVLISNPTREPSEFQMIARSRSVVIKEGTNIQLTCRTNQPWYLCSWVQPSEEECHRIVTDKYSTSCHSNDRIRFEGDERKEDCTIHIEDVQTSDSGRFQCIVKEKVHADHKEVNSLEVTVARPYALYVEPQELEIDLSGERGDNATAEVVCRAVGGGSVDPEVKWQLDGVTQGEDRTRQWEEIHSDGEKTLYLALSLEGLDLGEGENGAELRCLSRQYFPNKTIIYESTKTAHLTLLQDMGDQRTLSSVGKAGMTGVGGITITTIIAFAVVLTGALICYAQTKKVWCYKKSQKTARKPPSQESTTPAEEELINMQPMIPSRAPSEHGREPTVEVAAVQECGIDVHDAAVLRQDSILSQMTNPAPSAPPSAPPLHPAESTHQLLRLVSAPPTTTTITQDLSEPSPQEIETLRRKSERDRSKEMFEPELLSRPRPSIKRNSNEYVKHEMKPRLTSEISLAMESEPLPEDGEDPYSRPDEEDIEPRVETTQPPPLPGPRSRTITVASSANDVTLNQEIAAVVHNGGLRFADEAGDEPGTPMIGVDESDDDAELKVESTQPLPIPGPGPRSRTITVASSANDVTLDQEIAADVHIDLSRFDDPPGDEPGTPMIGVDESDASDLNSNRNSLSHASDSVPRMFITRNGETAL